VTLFVNSQQKMVLSSTTLPTSSLDTTSTHPRIRFNTHANYLRAFAFLAGYRPSTISQTTQPLKDALAELHARINTSQACREQKASRDRNVDLGQVRASLINAWGSEAILQITGTYATQGELLGLANNWGVVQLYYACYHVMHALLVAKATPRPDNHSKTQKQYISFWVDRSMQFAPWTLGYGYEGLRNGLTIRLINDGIDPRSPCTEDTCWDLAGKALRTTRTDAVNNALKTLRRERTKKQQRNQNMGNPIDQQPTTRTLRLTAKEKDKVDQDVRCHGLIDYLYRLRIRSNYHDATMFTHGPSSSEASQQVHADLCAIASLTMFVHEMRVASIVGHRQLHEWASDWLSTNRMGETEIGLALRLNLLGN